jgi:hypothetical protein
MDREKDLKAIIKIQEKIIKANAAAARTYKAELKETIELYGRAMENWLSAVDMIAGLEKDRINIWAQRNDAVRDYNAIHQLASYAAVPPLRHYDLPENMQLDPSKEYDFNVTSTVMESGKVKNKITVFPKSLPSQDLKKKKKKNKRIKKH